MRRGERGAAGQGRRGRERGGGEDGGEKGKKREEKKGRLTAKDRNGETERETNTLVYIHFF